jgi:hypothetical protein
MVRYTMEKGQLKFIGEIINSPLPISIFYFYVLFFFKTGNKVSDGILFT